MCIRDRYKIYHNVFFCSAKNSAQRGLSQQLLSTGRPTVYLRDMLQVTLLMGGRVGSAVGVVVVAPGTSSYVGRMLGNRGVEGRRN